MTPADVLPCRFLSGTATGSAGRMADQIPDALVAEAAKGTSDPQALALSSVRPRHGAGPSAPVTDPVPVLGGAIRFDVRPHEIGVPP